MFPFGKIVKYDLVPLSVWRNILGMAVYYFHKGAFRWGFADDHSLIRNSYYTGVTRRAANDEANALQCGDG